MVETTQLHSVKETVGKKQLVLIVEFYPNAGCKPVVGVREQAPYQAAKRPQVAFQLVQVTRLLPLRQPFFFITQNFGNSWGNERLP